MEGIVSSFNPEKQHILNLLPRIIPHKVSYSVTLKKLSRELILNFHWAISQRQKKLIVKRLTKNFGEGIEKITPIWAAVNDSNITNLVILYRDLKNSFVDIE